MHLLEKAILEAFKKNKGKDLTTSEIVRFVFPDDANSFDDSKSDDVFFLGNKKKILNSVRYRKALLHKRLLYHLNKLVENEVLKISGIADFGEKKFSLLQGINDLVISEKNKAIVIHGNSNPVTPVDGYESKRIVRKYASAHWIKRLDSILINSKSFPSISLLSEAMMSLFEEVNDVIGINSFEDMIQNNDKESIRTFLQDIAADSIDYGRNIIIIIDFDEIYDEARMKSFIRNFVELPKNRINVIFEVTSESLMKNATMFKVIIDGFYEKKIKINIKNKTLSKTPVFYGSAGVYSFNDKDWKLYKEEFEDKTIGLSCASSTLIIDVKEFFDNYSGIHEFRNFILKANKSLLIANMTKRKILGHYFKNINKLNKSYAREFFLCERNYLRFWNYDLTLSDKRSIFVSILKSLKEDTEKFCINEETIYGACGIPVRFKICFSSAFRKSDLTLTQRSYQKTTVNDMSYFESDETISYLKSRIKLLKSFENQDRIRFFRSSFDDSNEIINEFIHIMENFNIPLFTYDFAKIIGNTKLTTFFDKKD